MFDHLNSHSVQNIRDSCMLIRCSLGEHNGAVKEYCGWKSSPAALGRVGFHRGPLLPLTRGPSACREGRSGAIHVFPYVVQPTLNPIGCLVSRLAPWSLQRQHKTIPVNGNETVHNDNSNSKMGMNTTHKPLT